MVTRSSDEANLGEFVGKQLTIYPRAIAISGFLLLLFSVFLSETFWPFFILSVACFGLSYILSKKAKRNPQWRKSTQHYRTQLLEVENKPSHIGHSSEQPPSSPDAVPSSSTSMEKAIEQEVLLEMGYGLLVMADKGKGGDLLKRITSPHEFCKRNGMLLPTIVYGITLNSNKRISLLLRGKESRSSVMPDRFLAMNMGGGNDDKIDGVATVEPVFGIKPIGLPKKTSEKPKWRDSTVSIHLPFL